MRFSPKGLNFVNWTLFTTCKLDFVLNFIIQNPERIGSWDKKELGSICLPLCKLDFVYYHANYGKFGTLEVPF
jgi:hypothetical protein